MRVCVAKVAVKNSLYGLNYKDQLTHTYTHMHIDHRINKAMRHERTKKKSRTLNVKHGHKHDSHKGRLN